MLEVIEHGLCLFGPREVVCLPEQPIKRECFFASLLMKRLSAASRPVNCWTCRSVFGGRMLMMACIFSGLPSIPLSEMR
jgi:hypothetical protein